MFHVILHLTHKFCWILPHCVGTAYETHRQMGFHLHCGHLIAYSMLWLFLRCFLKTMFLSTFHLENIVTPFKCSLVPQLHVYQYRAKCINWGQILRSNTNPLQSLRKLQVHLKKEKFQSASVIITKLLQKNVLQAQLLLKST